LLRARRSASTAARWCVCCAQPTCTLRAARCAGGVPRLRHAPHRRQQRWCAWQAASWAGRLPAWPPSR
jgi:hypothetical protein